MIIGPAGVQRFREQQRVRRAVLEMSELPGLTVGERRPAERHGGRARLIALGIAGIAPVGHIVPPPPRKQSMIVIAYRLVYHHRRARGGARKDRHSNLPHSQVYRRIEARGKIETRGPGCLLQVVSQEMGPAIIVGPPPPCRCVFFRRRAASVGERGEGRVIVVRCQGQLLQIVGALHPPGRLSCRLHGGQQQRDEHADDCDDHQHLNERESTRYFCSLWHPLFPFPIVCLPREFLPLPYSRARRKLTSRKRFAESSD